MSQALCASCGMQLPAIFAVQQQSLCDACEAKITGLGVAWTGSRSMKENDHERQPAKK